MIAMAAKTRGRKLRAVGHAVEGKLTDIGSKSSEGIVEGFNTRTSTRQTRASAKEIADRIDGSRSSPEVKQTSDNSKPGKVRRVESEQEVMKANEHDREMCGRVQKSRTRACTRSERPVTRGNGLIAGAESGEDLEIEENCMPSAEDGNWTEQQEKVLQASLLTIKPGVNFWRLIAERVHGKSAEDCFKKFYSGRTTTRAAQRFRMLEELDSALTQRNGSKRVKSLQSKTPTNVKTPGRETRATRQAAIGPAQKENKTFGKGRNAGALTRQTKGTRTKDTKRRIEAASNSPDVKRIKGTKPQSTANFGALRQRARKCCKNIIGKHDLVEKAAVQASTPALALASEFDRSSDFDEGDENASAFGVSGDEDLWTKEQETALQVAYATIKPSANFWHLISKRVPGRSAEECFNKFYSAHPTPQRVAQRSCLKEIDCPTSLPKLPKAKTTGGKRLLEAHRTVRNILRRQQVDDEDYEADAFAALEPPDVVHSVMHSVSAMSNETDVKLCLYGPLPGSTENSTTQCRQSSKENRKPKAGGLSRDIGIAQSQVFSPEILKKVKDPLMLDKYIDHLHQRRTRRTGAKSAQKNAKRASGVYELAKDGLDFREVRLEAIHRAKQELRDVFLRPASAVDDPFLDLLDDTTDDNDDEEEEDGEAADSQKVL